MNELQTFTSNQFGEIRTVTLNGEPWFVGKDIAKALGYQNISRDINRHVDEDDRQNYRNGTFEISNRGVTIINESGLYSLILSSKMPNARKFKHWITSEVIPAIRKTGGYVDNSDTFVNHYFPGADDTTKSFIRTMLDNTERLNKQIEEQKPKVIFADAVSSSDSTILVGEMAKLLKQNNIDIGQKRLFEWLRSNGYLIKRKGSDWNMPTQRSMDMGLFEIKESTHLDGNGCNITTKTPKVTGKGQQYFINKFINRSA